ncbi:hypothetical protein Tco_0481977 [Tanacetum coccineum]
MSTSTHPVIILSDSDVEDAFSSTYYTLASPDYSPASLGNTSSDSKTKSDPSEDLSEDRSAPLAIIPFPDDPYMQIRRAYYATSEESNDSLSSSTIPPPPALVYPCRKARLLQPYVLEPFMQPFRYHPNGMTFIHTASKREIMPPQKQAHFLSPPSSPIDLSALPWVFEIRENSQTAAARQHTILTFMTCLECHEEQIDTILNH